jgi:hypothetical protein
MDVIYVKLNDEIFEEVLECLNENFVKYETMSKHSEFDAAAIKDNKELLRSYMKIAYDNSIVVKDSKSNKVVGAIICADFALTLKKPQIEVRSEKFKPIVAILRKQEENLLKIENYNIIEKQYLYTIATFVDHDLNGKNIGTTLYKMSEEDAYKCGFKNLVTIATGPISQHIRRKLNFAPIALIEYKSFEFNNEFPFKNIEEVSTINLMTKKLN